MVGAEEVSQNSYWLALGLYVCIRLRVVSSIVESLFLLVPEGCRRGGTRANHNSACRMANLKSTIRVRQIQYATA